MYAEGTSADAVAFNCVQRGHQQALETFPTFLACSLLGGVRHPVLATAAGLVYIRARNTWARLYAEGGASNRYASAWSVYIWRTLVGVSVASLSFAAGTAGLF